MRITASRRIIAYCLFGGLCVVTELAAGPELLAIGSITERATLWAETSKLPSTVDEMAALPQDYQKAAMQRLPAEVQRNIWRDHLFRIVDEKSWLDKTGRDFIRRTAAALEPADFVRTAQGPTPAVKRICEEASLIFGNNRQAKQIFTRIGTGLPTYATFASKRIAALEFVRRHLIVEAERQLCECSAGSWCSCWDCEYSGSVCARTNGCGCFWAYECDGLCPI